MHVRVRACECIFRFTSVCSRIAPRILVSVAGLPAVLQQLQILRALPVARAREHVGEALVQDEQKQVTAAVGGVTSPAGGRSTSHGCVGVPAVPRV